MRHPESAGCVHHADKFIVMIDQILPRSVTQRDFTRRIGFRDAGVAIAHLADFALLHEEMEMGLELLRR